MRTVNDNRFSSFFSALPIAMRVPVSSLVVRLHSTCRPVTVVVIVVLTTTTMQSL